MPEPILVVAPSRWRDACFSLPATRALAAVREVTLLCPGEQAPLWLAAGCGEVIAHDGSRQVLAGILAGIGAVLLWEDGPVAKACAKAGIPHRTGLPSAGLAKRLTHPLERLVTPGPPVHEVRRYLDAAALLAAKPFEPGWFEPLPFPRDPATTLIAPDSDFGRHFEWPLERWGELFSQLVPDPARVKVVPGPLGEALASQLGLETAALDHPTAAGRFERLIGADASLPHIAGALGVRCAVLYGPGDPRLTRPLGKRHSAIRHQVECSPCFAAKCPLDGRCQAELGVERVEDALLEFLKS